MWTSKQGSLCILYLRNRKIINSFKRSLRNFDHYFILPRKILERQLIMHQNMKILFITVFKKYGFQNNVWKSVHFLSDQLHQSTILNWFCVQSERSKGKRSVCSIYSYQMVMDSNQDDPILINIMDNSDVSALRKARLCFWLLSQRSGVNMSDKTNLY